MIQQARPSVFLLVSLLVSQVGCQTPGDGGSLRLSPNEKGAALYAEKCSVCHGSVGQGVSAPPLAGWNRGRQALLDVIEQRMPPSTPEPDRCKGPCAEAVSAFIEGGFAKGALSCPKNFSGPRRLRLLTRKEYENTIGDLFPNSGGGGTCGETTFRFDAASRSPMPRVVHVAGSFNGWPQTVGGGGYEMPYVAAEKAFLSKRILSPGMHLYKFVLDEKDWIKDPQNPKEAPDGFGGANSVLLIGACGSGPKLSAELLALLPAESRPDGFPFDNHEAARVVTSTHVEAYGQVAASLAQAASMLELSTILGCDPQKDMDGCIGHFVRTFGKRAFRRPLSQSEQGRYHDLVKKQKDLRSGVSAALQAFLTSPNFLYRSEMGEKDPLGPEGSYRLTGYEVASALSYFYWATMPDAALFAAAETGELGTPAGIEKQARRLLADPRSRQTLMRFAQFWLGISGVTSDPKHESRFPGFTEALRKDLLEETRRLVNHVVFDGSGQLQELFQSKYSFLNERLARHYGLPPRTGSELALAPYPNGENKRQGVLSHGSFLASYAHSDQTSPVRRGLFIRRNLLCQVLPPPPPDAGAIPEVDEKATTRERFRKHSESPACNGCHRYIDPVGLGLERYDAVGAYREMENGQPIDPSGDMNDLDLLGSGQKAPFATLPQLSDHLAASGSLRACFVRQMLRFSRGSRENLVNDHDLCALDQLTQRFQKSGDNIRDLLIAITTSPDFVSRR